MPAPRSPTQLDMKLNYLLQMRRDYVQHIICGKMEAFLYMLPTLKHFESLITHKLLNNFRSFGERKKKRMHRIFSLIEKRSGRTPTRRLSFFFIAMTAKSL